MTPRPMRGMFRIRRLARLPGPMTLQCAWSLGAANWQKSVLPDNERPRAGVTLQRPERGRDDRHLHKPAAIPPCTFPCCVGEKLPVEIDRPYDALGDVSDYSRRVLLSHMRPAKPTPQVGSNTKVPRMRPGGSRSGKHEPQFSREVPDMVQLFADYGG